MPHILSLFIYCPRHLPLLSFPVVFEIGMQSAVSDIVLPLLLNTSSMSSSATMVSPIFSENGSLGCYQIPVLESSFDKKITLTR